MEHHLTTLQEDHSLHHFPPPLNAIPLPSSRKRPPHDDLASPPAKRLLAPSSSSSSLDDVTFRLLLSYSKIGKVIGKQGARIRQLREESGAHIKISDPVSKAEDRVILISSKQEDTVESRSAAEYALVKVAILAINDLDENGATAKVGHQGIPNLTRLLIGRSQAGCLLGKGGSTINEIREISGANVRILPPEQMPFSSCISPNDRLVQISGELFQVQKALELIATKLRENPAREPVTLKPNYHQQQLMYAQAAYLGYSVQPCANGNGIAAAPYGATDPLASGTAEIPAMPKVTAEMSIPSALIGGIIGRGGANITQVRVLSGCTVKVLSEKDGASERVITFEGTAEQVSAAQSLVQAFRNAQ